MPVMGGDGIMQRTTSEKNNNFEQVRVVILYLERGSIVFSLIFKFSFPMVTYDFHFI